MISTILCASLYHRLKLRRLSTYLRASIPMPSAGPRGPHPADAPPIFALVEVCPSPHKPLLSPAPEEPLDEPAAPSCARRTRNPSRSSSTLNPVSAGASSSAPAPTSDDEGGSLNQTTHHPRLVLHVLSISEKVCRVLATVARICECTLRASARLHPVCVLLLPSPSAFSVPGSGILGRLLCTVNVRGSKTRS